MNEVRLQKVALVADLPGAAGVVAHTTHSTETGKYYEACKQLLTAEVNSAIDGLLTAGVAEVLVIDAHEPGAIHFESLHPVAQLLHGRPMLRRQMLDPLWECDAVALIGQHAQAGKRDGNQNQTLNAEIDSIKLNGTLIGESTLIALWAGVNNVPVIFLSGDEAACREIQLEIPGITTAAVKRGVSASVEITLSAPAARTLINQTIQKAVHSQYRAPLPPLRRPGPYRLEIRWKTTQDADMAEYQSGCERIDGQTVCFCSDDILTVLSLRHQPKSKKVHSSPSVSMPTFAGRNGTIRVPV